MVSILVCGGSDSEAEQVANRLAERGHEVSRLSAAEQAVAFYENGKADLVVVLVPLIKGSSGDLIRQLRVRDPRAPIVVAGRCDEVSGAPEALAFGATEYVPDASRDQEQLLSLIGVVLGSRKTDAQLQYLRQRDASGTDWTQLIGTSPAMRNVASILRHICHRTASGGTPTILVTGETGTGKGLIAKIIHYNSARRSCAFVDLNLAAVPATLLEAELFGCERGAFTDAKAPRPGLFEMANGGTLFLDEVGSLPVELQAKLLTAIEEKNIRRIGGSKARLVDVLIVAATHQNLAARVRRGEFRADLFHRLNVVMVELPPLRDRGDDKLLLAEAFIRRACREHGIPERELTDDARRKILRYSWPGNVRELRNQIERIILLEDDPVVRAEHFIVFGDGERREAHDATPEGEESAGSELAIGHSGEDLEISLPDRPFALEQVEREILRKALERHDGNVSQTARFVGVTRQTLIYRMKKHGLAPLQELASTGTEGDA